MQKLNIWKEIRKQLTNTPSFGMKMADLEKVESAHFEHIQKQIEKAVQDKEYSYIFLIGPLGSGKTTQISHFIHTHPKLNYTYKSFVKINDLDFAFLHLTNYLSRFIFLILASLVALLIMYIIPGLSSLPFLTVAAYLFAKNSYSFIYIIHETLDNIFTRKHRLVILEDLERSSLSPANQWAMLANLWQYRRTYLVSLGYSYDDKKAQLSMIEYAEKLGGLIIELLPYKQLNFSVIKKIDPDFPFMIDPHGSKGDWLSLFTPREMLMIKDQASLKALSSYSKENKKLQYIEVCLELLLAKQGLLKGQIAYDETTKTLKPFISKEMSSEQKHFMSSFSDSIAN